MVLGMPVCDRIHILPLKIVLPGFVYGLGWGVNQGILKDRKYKKAARKGWKALKSYVHEDGMLGYVQPVSAAPEQVTQNMTEVYGVGAFLMAGIEMLKMK